MGQLADKLLQAFKGESERQKMRRQLESTGEKYNALMETSTDGALLLIEGQIAFANFVFLAMSGYTLNDIKSMKLNDLIVEPGTDLDNGLPGN